jgi:hypothetical protein
MTTFDEREQAFEAGFAHDEEVRFKILAHRNALLGRWVADRLGYTGAVADKYIEKITDALCEPTRRALGTDDRVISKLVMDLTTSGWTITREDLRKILSDFEDQARTAVMEGRTA